MSSITSKTVRDLYEAYNSVYIDETELFLNDLLDTVTESVNELVNEGYDLSDYSWDEIYESFLENVLDPELQEVESSITQLNESAEELTEEQIENLLENRLLRGLSFFSRGPKVTGSGGVTIPRPQPTPGTGRPLRNPRQLELPVGQDKGSFARFGDWLSSLTSKGRAQQAAKPPAPTQPPTPKPPTGQPRQPFQMPDLRPASQRMGQGLQAVQKRLGDVVNVVKRTPEFVQKVAIPSAKIGLSVGAGLAGGGELINQIGSLATGKGVAPSPFVSGAASAARLSSRAASALANKSSPSYAAGLRSTAQQASNLAKELDAYNIRQEKQAAAKDKAAGRTTPPPTQPRRRNTPPESLTQSFEISGDNINEEPKFPTEKPKAGDWAKLTRGGITKIWDPETNSYQLPGTINKRLKSQGEKLIKVPGRAPVPAKPKQDPIGQPAKPKQDPVGQPAKPKQDPVGQPAKPKQDPVTQPPVKPAPAPTPFGRTMPAPAAADLDKYKINKDWAVANPRLAQAQVARASGQPRADINKILYKPGTAAYGAAGKSEMEKQVDQMRQKREEMAKKREAEQTGPKATQKESKMIKEPYDLVLEYLFSQGHVDTLDEAHYVMLQMDSNYIQSIVEGGGPLLPGEPGKALVLDIKNLFCLESKEQSII